MKSRSVRWLLFPLLVLNALSWTPARRAMGQEIPSVVGNPARGRDAFVEKGCIACHAVRGAGGKTGSDLAAALVGKGIVGVAAAMINHYEMAHVLAYLYPLRSTGAPGTPARGMQLFERSGNVPAASDITDVLSYLHEQRKQRSSQGHSGARQ